MRWLILAMALAMAACGADGEPDPVQGGIAVSGEARIGVKGSL